MNIWDKTKPLPSEYINTFYDYLRNLKELFLDRFGLDHNMDGVLDTSLATADGYHKQLTMRDYEDIDEYSNPVYFPWFTENSQQLFVKEISGLHELCCQYNEGVCQLTKNGKVATGYFWEILMVEPVAMYGLCYGNGLFVKVGTVGKIYTSTNGMDWTSRSSGITSTLRFVSYVNGIFLAGGDGGKFLSSSDGETWTLIPLTTTQTLHTACFHDGIYLLSSNSTVFKTSYSTDLINWYATPSIVNNYGLIYAFGMYIGGGPQGIIQTTTDLSSWTKRLELSWTDPVYDSFNDLCYGNNIVVAVGQYGKIYTSEDGISWTKRVSGLTEVADSSLSSISFLGGVVNRFCAVNGKGLILLSDDGITWERISGVTTSAFYSVINNEVSFFADGEYLAVSKGIGT